LKFLDKKKNSAHKLQSTKNKNISVKNYYYSSLSKPEGQDVTTLQN